MNRTQKSAIKAISGALLLGAVAYFADPAALWARLRDANAWWLAAGLCAAIASNVVSAWRWRALAQWLGAHMGWGDALRWYFQAIGLNALLPGAVVGGDVYRAVVLQRTGQGKAASSLSVLLDRLSGLWMLCALGAIGAAVSAPVLAPVVRIPVPALVAVMLLGTALWLALPWALLWWLGRRDAAQLPAWLAPLLQAAKRPDFNQQMLVQAASSVWRLNPHRHQRRLRNPGRTRGCTPRISPAYTTFTRRDWSTPLISMPRPARVRGRWSSIS